MENLLICSFLYTARKIRAAQCGVKSPSRKGLSPSASMNVGQRHQRLTILVKITLELLVSGSTSSFC